MPIRMPIYLQKNQLLSILLLILKCFWIDMRSAIREGNFQLFNYFNFQALYEIETFSLIWEKITISIRLYYCNTLLKILVHIACLDVEASRFLTIFEDFLKFLKKFFDLKKFIF